ncbi:CoA transferase [bacterium]|nr:CoA transferase [bacterium]
MSENTRADTSDNWISRLNKVGVPCGEINSIDKVFSSPQVVHLGIARDMNSQERGATRVVGQPIIMSESEPTIRRPPPKLGQHTREILAECEYNEAEIAAFEEAGAI